VYLTLQVAFGYDALSQSWPNSTHWTATYFVKDSPEPACFYAHVERDEGGGGRMNSTEHHYMQM
jgi:hypothetical protein